MATRKQIDDVIAGREPPAEIHGASDAKWGAAGSLYDFSNDTRLNHRLRIISGVEAHTCAAMMKAFFAARR